MMMMQNKTADEDAGAEDPKSDVEEPEERANSSTSTTDSKSSSSASDGEEAGHEADVWLGEQAYSNCAEEYVEADEQQDIGEFGSQEQPTHDIGAFGTADETARNEDSALVSQAPARAAVQP